MKKMKMFFIAATLLLVTAGVFAGKSKFFTTYTVYAALPTLGEYEVIETGATISNTAPFTFTVGTAQSILTSSNGIQYGVYAYGTGANYVPLYTTF